MKIILTDNILNSSWVGFITIINDEAGVKVDHDNSIVSGLNRRLLLVIVYFTKCSCRYLPHAQELRQEHSWHEL